MRLVFVGHCGLAVGVTVRLIRLPARSAKPRANSGTFFAPNITPDVETGIGAWSFEDFKRTIRTGTNPRGEALLPPMPIANLRNLPDSDLRAMYSYLRTLKPIKNRVGRTTGPSAPSPGGN